MHKKLCLLLLSSLFLGLPLSAQPEENPVKFEDLSLQEQIGQTLTVFVDIDSAEMFRPAIESGQVGGVLIQWGNYSLEQTRVLIDKLQSWAAKSPHKIPLLISIDYEGAPFILLLPWVLIIYQPI